MSNWTYAAVATMTGLDAGSFLIVRKSPDGAVTVGQIVTPVMPGGSSDDDWRVAGIGMIGANIALFQYGASGLIGGHMRVVLCPLSNSPEAIPEAGETVADMLFGSLEPFSIEPFLGAVIGGVGVFIGSYTGSVTVGSVFFDGEPPSVQVIESPPGAVDLINARGISASGDGTFEINCGRYDSSESSAESIGAEYSFFLNSPGTHLSPVRRAVIHGSSDMYGAVDTNAIGDATASAVAFFANTGKEKGINTASRNNRLTHASHERTGANSGRVMMVTNLDDLGDLSLRNSITDYTLSYSRPAADNVLIDLSVVVDVDIGSPVSEAESSMGIGSGELHCVYHGWMDADSSVGPKRFWTALKSAQEIP